MAALTLRTGRIAPGHRLHNAAPARAGAARRDFGSIPLLPAPTRPLRLRDPDLTPTPRARSGSLQLLSHNMQEGRPIQNHTWELAVPMAGEGASKPPHMSVEGAQGAALRAADTYRPAPAVMETVALRRSALSRTHSTAPWGKQACKARGTGEPGNPLEVRTTSAYWILVSFPLPDCRTHATCVHGASEGLTGGCQLLVTASKM